MKKAPRIVFAGNNSRLAMVLNRFFQDIGFQLTMIAGNGAHAIEAVKEHQPLMVFINTPLDGPLSTHETSLEIEQNHGVPVVMVNDIAESDDIQAKFNFHELESGEMFRAICGVARDICGLPEE